METVITNNLLNAPPAKKVAEMRSPAESRRFFLATDSIAVTSGGESQRGMGPQMPDSQMNWGVCGLDMGVTGRWEEGVTFGTYSFVIQAGGISILIQERGTNVEGDERKAQEPVVQ